MRNFLSVDFESWVYPDLPKFKKLNCWQRKKLDDGYVKEAAEKILKLLAKYKAKLTFFILGELYEWYPEVITWLAQEGHEVAYHSHRHDILYSQEDLLSTLGNSRAFLEKFRPKGFRAPEILIKKEYLKVLSDYGFVYDSSVYGPFNLKEKVGKIIEIPITTYSLFSGKPSLFFPRTFSPGMLLRELPVGSGFFLASLGRKIEWFIRLLNKKGLPFVGFLHNWQIIKPKNATFPSKNYLLTHPTYLPYTRDCYNVFEYLLTNFEFGKTEELLVKIHTPGVQ